VKKVQKLQLCRSEQQWVCLVWWEACACRRQRCFLPLFLWDRSFSDAMFQCIRDASFWAVWMLRKTDALCQPHL